MSEDREIQAQTASTGDDGHPSADARGRAVTSRADFAAELQDFIARNPQIFPGADIFNLDYLDALDRSGMLAGVLTGLMSTDHRPAVRSFVIIATPETDLEVAHSRAWSALLETFQLLGDRAVSLCANIDETLTEAIITELGGQGEPS